MAPTTTAGEFCTFSLFPEHICRADPFTNRQLKRNSPISYSLTLNFSVWPSATSPYDPPPSYVEAQLPWHEPLNLVSLSPSVRLGIISSGLAASRTQFDLPPSYEEAVRAAKDEEPPMCSSFSKEKC